ncbi:MAG: substrate-binding domain-containing protein [Spirochaetaceae bacterium]|nr:substrate-binding domain-containing protein [Spirochaetaceae bacterium]
MRLKTTVLLILTSLLLFTSCNKSEFLKGKESKPKKIAFISISRGGQLWGNIKNGARMAHGETSCLLDFYSPVEETDAFQQIEFLKEAGESDFDVIIIDPSDVTLLAGPIEDLQNKGVKVLQIYNESVAYNGFRQFKLMSNFSPVGEAIGNFIIDNKSNQAVHVLIVGALLHTSSGSQTELGIKKMFKDNSDLKFDTIYCFGDSDKAEELISAKIKKNETINFIIALDETSSDGIIKAIDNKSIDTSKIFVLAWGNTLNNIQGLEDGSIKGIVAINGFGLGYRAIYAAIDLANGKEVPTTPLDFSIVTKESFSEERNQRLLFPQIL